MTPQDQAEPDQYAASMRVLVIDDDPAIRQVVVNYLEQHNLRVISASGRQDMIRHFAMGEPDLVVLDLRLGREDGLELLREIRARSDVPVIIATGHRRDEIDRVVGLELGADDTSPSRSVFGNCWRGSGRASAMGNRARDPSSRS